MPKNKKSIFAGGWSASKAEKLAKVEVPEKMRCSICKKMKAISTYSKKQQLDLKNHIALGYDIDHSGIRCRKCTGSQVHEMTCSICNDVKGLEGFSKAQRRTPDNARCIDCVNDHQSVHPNMRDEWDFEDSEDDEDSNPDSESNTCDVEDDITTSGIDGVSSSMNQLNFENVKHLDHVTGSERANRGASATFSGRESQTGVNDNIPTRSTDNFDGSVWRDYSYKNGRSAQGKLATEFTGWDSQGNPHHRVRAPSTVMTDENGSAKAPARSSKFARVKSDNPFGLSRRSSPPPVAPKMVSGNQVNYSDEDTDSDWGVLN